MIKCIDGKMEFSANLLEAINYLWQKVPGTIPVPELEKLIYA